MRAVVQRVSQASVHVEDSVSGAIERGLLVYLGVGNEDDECDARYIVNKIRHLRIFPDDEGRLNRDVVQAEGKVLVVSAFTIQADARRGRRPSFDAAASPDHAVRLYDQACEELRQSGVSVELGVFRAMMDVHSTNAGPICILLDSKRGF
ncbi:MAG: D-aminoacyl-tRNA deacylase [Phycisphaerae bacterium]|jgi:D-tyrosyl-tRNA(Tyr) deacylase